MQGLLGSGVGKLLWYRAPGSAGWLLCSATQIRRVRDKATQKVQDSCGGQLPLFHTAWAVLESCCHHMCLQRLLGSWGPSNGLSPHPSIPWGLSWLLSCLDSCHVALEEYQD